MHRAGFEVGVETNGTLAAPKGIDWLCVSPKGVAEYCFANPKWKLCLQTHKCLEID
ncbi:MAG TPA: hypothetical protein VL020_05190 [Pseudomonadales bacterium]|nr:hypothetical protein [Pseudomonadales bacterium]